MSTAQTMLAPVAWEQMKGLIVVPLQCIPTHGGPVLHMLRADSPLYSGFGEVYFSEVEPGCIKGWKLHTRQTQLFAVPSGRMRIVVRDEREGSTTQGQFANIILGRPDAYALVRIEPGLWYAFEALGAVPALMCNCADIPHNPEEARRCELNALVYPRFCE